MKVLVSALSCHPQGTSEEDVGWNWVVQAARHHEVWVITKINHQESIERELGARPIDNLNFVFHEVPMEVPIWNLTHRFLPVRYLSYMAWQMTAYWTAKKLHEQVRFDVAHHLTWASHRFPTFLAWLDIPYVWGPVGGGEGAPLALYREMGLRTVLGEVTRNVSNFSARLNPFVRRTAQRAAHILVTSEQTRDVLPRTAMAKAEVYPAIGLDANRLEAELMSKGDTRHEETTPRLLFVGRLTSWKGCSLALDALALLRRDMPARLTIVGEGPERGGLERRAAELGITPYVDFLGNVPRADVLQLCRSHDVFVFPSLHDSGGIAVLEAMYLGLPVVCLDLGGPALSVGEAGIRVKCHTGRQVARDLVEAIALVLRNGELRGHLTEEARRRVLNVYDWEQKAPFIRDLYEKAARKNSASV